jgi:hypothetical protein
VQRGKVEKRRGREGRRGRGRRQGRGRSCTNLLFKRRGARPSACMYHKYLSTLGSVSKYLNSVITVSQQYHNSRKL